MNRLNWIGLFGFLLFVVGGVFVFTFNSSTVGKVPFGFWIGVAVVFVLGMALMGYVAVKSLGSKPRLSSDK